MRAMHREDTRGEVRKEMWAVYHNPPNGPMMNPLSYDTKCEANAALKRLESKGLRWAYIDKFKSIAVTEKYSD